ncbi:helix-hairpin-helix domain-containing protein [Actinocorallia longicatena]|uniref:ATP-dependent RecD2 DNA helicase-like helix-hairpin-helix domain-containing protein n=1 Tax=Actinocorallia longicatena TaxID=111803 RepID=A0ABP6Q464_9ACTN
MSDAFTLLPDAIAARARAYLGDDANTLLLADPWDLLKVPGIQPEQADHLAKALLPNANPQDPRRGRALVGHLLGIAARDGDTALPGAEVVEALKRMRIADPVAAINAAIEDGSVVLVMVEPDVPEDADELPDEEEWLALARYARAEKAVAEGVQRLQAAPPLEIPMVHEAARQAVFHGVSIAVGPAADLVAELAAAPGLAVAVATATAAAALEFPGAVSLHALLGAREGGFARGPEFPLEAGLVVVAGAEALDVEAAAALIEACPDGTHLLLIGDPGGLASHRPGRVLADLIDSGTIPVTEFPPDDDPLAHFVEEVRIGAWTEVDAPGHEVVIVPVADGREAAHRLSQLLADSIPRALGIPTSDVQVLTPALQGTAALNTALKARLNPGPGACGGFDVGDRVLVAVPLPGAPAGETGTVTAAAADGLTFDSPAGAVKVPAAHLPRLRHGWAIPVQQAVGTRWPAVIAVFPTADALTQPLALTAFTRARRHLSVVTAAGPALPDAIAAQAPVVRRTRLAGLLR